MLTNIDYMIDYSELMNNLKAAKIFDDMENFIQDLKLKIQQLIMSDKVTQPKEGSIEFAAFTEKTKLSPDSGDMWDGTMENNIFCNQRLITNEPHHLFINHQLIYMNFYKYMSFHIEKHQRKEWVCMNQLT